MAHQTFTQFLQEIHAKDYHGTDDDMPDAFEKWIGEQDIAQILEWGDEYGNQFQV